MFPKMRSSARKWIAQFLSLVFAVVAVAPLCEGAERRWVQADYLHWWMRGSSAPALISTSSNVELLGDLDSHETQVPFGGQRFNDQGAGGWRLRMGTWWDCQATQGWEVDFLMICPGKPSARAGSNDGSSFVGRPFVAIREQQGDLVRANTAQLVSAPGLGGFVEARSEWSLWGGALLLRQNLCSDGCEFGLSDGCAADAWAHRRSACYSLNRHDLLAGFRYLSYSDRISIREQLEILDPPPEPFLTPGTKFDIVDRFQAWNDFFGLTLGLDSQWHRGRWSLEARPQAHIGVLHRRVSIRGEKEIRTPGQNSMNYVGGLLALESNIGNYRSQTLTVVPELDLRIGYLLGPRLRLVAGYSCLVFPQLLRAAEQIDPVIDPRLIAPVAPGPQLGQPAYAARTSYAWIQGISLGLEASW